MIMMKLNDITMINDDFDDTSNVYVLVMFALGHTAPGHAALTPFSLL